MWTIRGAPHVYRRADLAGVAAATAPFSDADAGKRIFDASKPLKAAGIPNLAALDAVADAMRSIVTAPMVKGEMSTRLTAVLDEPYLRFCRPCDAVHTYEQPFRLAALRAGLELEPGTSPPVLRPGPGLAPADRRCPTGSTSSAAYLRLLGPATPQHVAGYLDAPVKDVKAHWPDDAVEVDGRRRAALAARRRRRPAGRGRPPRSPACSARSTSTCRRGTARSLVPDPGQAKDLWRTLGRPGGVLVDGEVVAPGGRGRPGPPSPSPSSSGRRWTGAGLAEQAERLAAFRGLTLAGVEVSG